MRTSRIIATLFLLVQAAMLCHGQDSSSLSGVRIDSVGRVKDTFAGPELLSDKMTGDILTGDSLPVPEDSIFIPATTMRDSITGTADDSNLFIPANAGLPDSVINRYDTIKTLQNTSDNGRDSVNNGRDVAENPPVPVVVGDGTTVKNADRRITDTRQVLQKGAAVRLIEGSITDSSRGLPEPDALASARIEDTLMTADTSMVSQAARRIPSVKGIFSFSKVFWALVLLLISYLIIRVITKFMNIVAERSARLRIWLKGLIPVFRIVAWTAVIFMIIQGIFKPNWQTILALSASVGVAVGFAAQDILKNIFGGFTILAEKAFQVGDKIQVGEHYGEVLSIGFRSTKVRTGDDSVVTVPNAELTAKPISNSNSGETNCQVVAEFYLPETIDFEKVRRIATEAAQISGFVYLNKPITVLFLHELRENVTFIKMRLKAYVLDIRYEFVFKSQMTEIVMDALRKENII